MNSGRIKRHTNDCINELVFSVLYNASTEDIMKLKGRFKTAVRTSGTARSFADKSSMDDKLAILSELGVDYFLIISDRNELGMAAVKSVLEEYKNDFYSKGIKRASELNVYAVSNKEEIQTLGLLAQTVNHPSYIMELEFNRVGFHMRGWQRNHKSNSRVLGAEIVDNAEYILKSFGNIIKVIDNSSFHFGMSKSELEILMFLYPHRHTYIKTEKILSHFAGIPYGHLIKTRLSMLVRNQYVQMHIKDKPRRYTITALGITIINRFLHKVIELSKFE